MSNFSSKLTSSVSIIAILAATLSTSLVSAASEFLTYAEVLAENDVISAQSTEAGYRLGDNVTRAEISKVVANLGGYFPTDCAGDIYSDVGPAIGDLCGYIEALAEGGVVSTAVSTFRPTANVTRAEMVKMILAALGEEPSSSSEADYMDLTGLGDLAGYVNRAYEIGCASNASYFRPNATSTRGEAFKIASCAAGLYLDTDPVDPIDPTPVDPTPVDPTPGTGGTVPNPNGTGTVAVAGSLAVSLEGTASAMYVPRNGSAINVGKVKLTAGASDVLVSSVTIGRSGLGNINDISKIYSATNGVVNNNNSYNSNAQEGMIFFSPALTLKAGTSVTMDVLISLTAGAQANSQHQFTVKAVASTAASTTGLPTTIGLINTTSATVASVTATTAGSASTYRVGDVGVELGQFKLTNNSTEDKNVTFTAISLRNNGNADIAKNLSNLAVYRDGAKVSSGVVVDGKGITFMTNDSILFGRTNTYSVRGDIKGVDNVAGDTYNFQVRYTTDISGVETTSGFGVNVTGTPTLATYTVSGGDVVLSRDSSQASTQTVSAGTNDVVLAAGTLGVAAPISLEGFMLSFNGLPTESALAATFSTLRLVIGGVTVATYSPITGNTNTSMTFGGKYTVPASTTIKVIGNVRSTATAGTFKVTDLAFASFNVKEYVSNGNSIAAGSFIGSVPGVNVTIGNAGLTFSRNDGLSSQSVTAGSTNLVLGRYNVNASDTSDVRITQLKFTNAAALSNNTNLTAVKIYRIDGTTATLLDTKSFSAGNADFNGLSINIPKNGSMTLEVRGDFTTNETGAFALQLLAANIMAQDTNSATLPLIALTAPAPGPTYTFVGAGSATLTRHSNTPNASVVTAGFNGEVARIAFQAKDDDLTLKDIYVFNSGSASLSNVVATATLTDEADAILAIGTVVGNTIKFSLGTTPGFKVLKNTSSRYAKVKLTISQDAIKDGALSNKTLQLGVGIRGLDFTAVAGTVNGAHFVSDATGNDVAVVSNTGSSVVNTHLVTRSKPVVAVTSTTGELTRNSFTVTADASNKIQANSVTFSMSNANTGVTFTVYKNTVNSGNEVSATGIVLVNGTNTVTFTAPVEISAGSSMTYIIEYTGITSIPQTTTNRIFKITDLSFVDVMDTGANQTITSIAPYTNVGIPTAEQRSTY